MATISPFGRFMKVTMLGERYELIPLVAIMSGTTSMAVLKLIHASMAEDIRWRDRAHEPYMFDKMRNPHHRKLYPLQQHDMTKVYAPYPPDDMRRNMVEFDEEYEQKFGKAAAVFEGSRRAGNPIAGSSVVHTAQAVTDTGSYARWVSNSPLTWSARKTK